MSERVLAMEVVLSTVAVTARELEAGRAPSPAVYAASLTVFGALSALSRMYDPASHFAEMFGGLVVLAEFVNPGGPARAIIGIFSRAATVTNARNGAATTAAAVPGPSASDQLITAATTA